LTTMILVSLPTQPRQRRTFRHRRDRPA
jgi:hypothetical protein